MTYNQFIREYNTYREALQSLSQNFVNLYPSFEDALKAMVEQIKFEQGGCG